VGLAVLVPGYILPLLLLGRPLLPHPVTMLISAIVPFTLAIAILRYRLFDIEVIINRTLVYGTLTMLLGGLYLLLVSSLSLVTPLLFDQGSDTLVVFIATMCIALAFAPLRRQVQISIDRTFYHTKLDYQRLLPEVSERLASSIVLDDLAISLTKELPRKLQIAWAALAVLDSSNCYLELTGSNDRYQVLSVDHPLIKYLHRSKRPLMRLLPPPHLPAEAQAFLDENIIELSIPLIVGVELVGLYNLGPKLSERGYGPDEVRLLHFLGQQIAIAVENGRLFQATGRQTQELAGLHETAVAVSSSLEVEEVLATLAEQLGRVLDVSSAYVCDLNMETLQSTVLAEWISSQATDWDSDLGTTYDMRQHPTTLKALTEKQALVIQATDPDLDSTDRTSAEKYSWHSILIVPLVIRDRVTGYAELWETRRERQFTAADIRLCQTAAADAAAAIEHARLFQAEREQRRLAEALQKAADVVSGTLDLDQVLDRILEQVERVVVGDVINIMLVESGIAWVVRWRGYERQSGKRPIANLCLPVAKYPALTQMMESGKPLVVPNTATDPDWVPLEGWKWLRSYVSAPIQVGGQTIGFLNVGQAELGQFGPADAQRLEAFAYHAATALENARLYTKVERQLREQTALREAGTVISSTLDSQTVLSRIAEQMSQVIDATSAYISRFDPKTKTATVIAEYISPLACAAEQVSDLNYTYEETAEVEWLESMQAGQHDVSHIDDPDMSSSERLHMLQYGAKSILYIPLRIRKQFIGYAELWESRQRREFTAEEIALCQDIAQQAAIALENARLYEQAQQEIADRKQAEEQIKASLEEKELLLKEIHHRVKNNLQVISSLLYLQSKQIEDQTTLSMFHESRHRVRSMALVHEKLYQTKDLASVDFSEYVRQLASYLLRSYGATSNQITLEIDVDRVSLGIDTAIPCGLIVNELVSNSLKHAFPGGQKGKILIELQTTQDGQYALTIGDNGTGIPTNLNLQTTESLGLQLVSTLVDQLGGDIKVNQKNGTKFEITFADPQHEGEG
jgi:two-component sensor histidine kinase